METLRANKSKITNSREAFSFPSTPSTDHGFEFEFGSITPGSPSLTHLDTTSPADHLFSNGRLLPHSFPVHPSNKVNISDHHLRLALTRRTSSCKSKESLFSSRSNSINSSRSSCSSARSSLSSDAPERKLLFYKSLSAQVYGASQRLQIMTPVMALHRDPSRRVKKRDEIGIKKEEKRDKRQKEGRKGSRALLGERFWRWFWLACRECHAMEPSRKDDILAANAIVVP